MMCISSPRMITSGSSGFRPRIIPPCWMASASSSSIPLRFWKVAGEGSRQRRWTGLRLSSRRMMVLCRSYSPIIRSACRTRGAIRSSWIILMGIPSRGGSALPASSAGAGSRCASAAIRTGCIHAAPMAPHSSACHRFLRAIRCFHRLQAGSASRMYQRMAWWISARRCWCRAVRSA